MTTHAYFDTDGAIAALAHRGFSLDGLENSMAAFGAAVDMGYRYVETDAHGTSDGMAVALHDAELDRTTDAQGEVATLPWSTVKRAKIGGVEAVPLLEDIFGTWPELRVNIDIKGESGIQPVVDAVERTGAHNRVCLTSFSTARRKAAVAQLSRPVATSAGTSEAVAFAMRGGVGLGLAGPLSDVGGLQIPWRLGAWKYLTQRHIAAAHRAGKVVHVWTINERAEMEALLDRGVDGIVTDRADILKELLQERGRWE